MVLKQQEALPVGLDILVDWLPFKNIIGELLGCWDKPSEALVRETRRFTEEIALKVLEASFGGGAPFPELRRRLQELQREVTVQTEKSSSVSS